jgi:prepilin peptidase CpaA
VNLPMLAPYWAFTGLLILLVLAALQDAVMLKISNYLVGAVLLLAVVAIAVAGPRLELWENGAAFLLALVIGTFLFGRGILGGGDVKLFAATILWFDFTGAARLLLWTAISGGVLAILIIVLRTLPWPDRLRSRVRVLQPKAGIPYGIAIAAGAILTSLMLGMSAAPALTR